MASAAARVTHWRGWRGEWQRDGTRAELLHAADGRVYLFMIETVEHLRGRGRGSRLLARLCRAADRAGVTLYLLPMHDDPRQIERLRGWYRRHGFVDVPPNWCGLVGMERTPRDT